MYQVYKNVHDIAVSVWSTCHFTVYPGSVFLKDISYGECWKYDFWASRFPNYLREDTPIPLCKLALSALLFKPPLSWKYAPPSLTFLLIEEAPFQVALDINFTISVKASHLIKFVLGVAIVSVWCTCWSKCWTELIFVLLLALTLVLRLLFVRSEQSDISLFFNNFVNTTDLFIFTTNDHLSLCSSPETRHISKHVLSKLSGNWKKLNWMTQWVAV